LHLQLIEAAGVSVCASKLSGNSNCFPSHATDCSSVESQVTRPWGATETYLILTDEQRHELRRVNRKFLESSPIQEIPMSVKSHRGTVGGGATYKRRPTGSAWRSLGPPKNSLG